MPIKFRCRHCRQFLGISRAQAGEVTDCPMCGKSIRVPNLDGSIAPIPQPELNLQDSQLVQALGELAELGGSRSPGETANVTSPPRISETFEATLVMPAAEPVPFPQSIPAQPIVAPSDVASSSKDADTIIQAGDDVGTVDFADETLRTLADSSPRRAMPRRRWNADRRSWWVIGLTSAGLATLLAFIWFGGGNESQPAALEAASQEDVPSVGPKAVLPAGHRPADSVSVGEPAVTGRVTYVSDSGDSRPDKGARILMLPKLKPGSVKLDVAGFLAGAEGIDVQVAQAAVRALGGDIATAGEDGRYDLSVSTAGDYHLLAISRHQSRDSAGTVSQRLQETLSAYFFRPSSLLGGLSFKFDEFHYRGQGTSPRDFTFVIE